MRTKNQRIKSEVFRGMFVFGLIIVAIIGAWQTQTIKDFVSQASYNPANFYVDTQSILGTLSRPWRNLAQGGEDHNWRLEPIAPYIRDLRPNYIRIDHIYDFYDIVQGSSGNLSFDFSKLDMILNDIRNVGARPFISLSYMPPAISAGNIVDKPINYNDWQLLVEKTIEHVSGAMGFDNVYYEVWNEPDLFGEWKYYGNKNYLDLYAAAARGAAAANNVSSFKFGGPATTALYKNWVEALLTMATEQNLRLDFISWHRYSNDIDQYNSDILNIQKWLRAFPKFDGLIEYHITEWGQDSKNNPSYDTQYSAAHTVATAIQMIGVIDSAFVFEIQDGNDPAGQEYWGRWGLFTSTLSGQKPKPRYYGLKMLDSIDGQRLQLLGQGSMIKGIATKTAKNVIQMVIANFDPKAKNQEAVPITYQNINPGNYLVKTQYLSGKSTVIETATDSANLRTTVLMPVNDVAFVELLPRQTP